MGEESLYLESGELVLHVTSEGVVDCRHGVCRLLPELQQGRLPGMEEIHSPIHE